MNVKWKIVCAELLGTLVLVFLGNGVVCNVVLKKSKGEGGGWMVIASGWAFAVTTPVYLVGWISGAHLNPAVTLGLCSIHLSEWSMLPFYWTGQFIGGFLGAILVWATYQPHFLATTEPSKKIVCFATQPAIRAFPWNFVAELLGTFMLVFGFLGIFDDHNGLVPWIKPCLLGMLIWAIGGSLGGPTGYAINPARDLSPRIAHALLPLGKKGPSDWSYSWIPIAAPLVGGILGAFAYRCFVLLFHP